MAPNQNDRNVLDLRRIAAERQAATAKPRRWSAQRMRVTQARETLHRPARPPRDWRVVRREMLKFGGALTAIVLVVAMIVTATSVTAHQDTVEQAARQGIDELQQGLSFLGQSQSEQAVNAFHQAAVTLQGAQDQASRFFPSALDRAPMVGKKLTTARRLLRDARDAAHVGEKLSALLPAETLKQPAVTIQSNGIIQGSVGVLASLMTHRDTFVQSVQEAARVIGDLENINPADVPGSIRPQFSSWQRLLTGLVGSSQALQSTTNLLTDLFAPAETKEYLIVFQNNDEIRPTGGFLGTYLLVQFSQGTFKILDAPGNGPYALSDEVAKVNLPPQPMLAMVPIWTFHDANWFLDVPTSATTMLQMYAQDRGFTPDGVIFMSPGIMEDLLRVTGPIRPAKYQIDITADNFVAATEQQVQFRYDKALNNPKQFLIDLVPEMLIRLSHLSGPDAMRALALTLKRANQGDLLLYSREAEMQHDIAALGWDGALQTLTDDGLAVVDTNLGGGKTDRVIDERVRVAVRVEGTLLYHDVTVTRTHRGVKGDILTGDTNRDFIRVYAPSSAQYVGVTGSSLPTKDFFQPAGPATKPTKILTETEGQTLLDDTTGIRLTNESGRKVFGAWSLLAPGETQAVTFTYTTPLSTTPLQSWRFDWQHQPGATVRAWEMVFTAPSGQKITEGTAGGTLSNGQRTLTWTTDSTTSKMFEARIK